MTLAFALRGSNGLVLGADSRVSGVGGSADTSTKFLQINREIGVLTYGLAEVGYKAITVLADKVNKTTEFDVKKKRMVYFSEIADLAKSTFKETFESWFTQFRITDSNAKPEEFRFSTGFILGGYDSNETNQFKILHWVSPRFDTEERADILAAQWQISQYLTNHLYYPEMNVELLSRLAVFMLVETELVSQSVGGPLQIATVTLENGFQRLNESDVRNLINENQPRFAEFRRILLEELR